MVPHAHVASRLATRLRRVVARIQSVGATQVDVKNTDQPPSEPADSGAATLRLMLIEDDRTYAWLVEEMLVDAFSAESLDVTSFGSLADATEETGVVDCALVD